MKTKNMVKEFGDKFFARGLVLGIICLMLFSFGIGITYAQQYDYDVKVTADKDGKFKAVIKVPGLKRGDPAPIVTTTKNIGTRVVTSDEGEMVMGGKLIDKTKPGEMIGTIKPSTGPNAGKKLTWRVKVNHPPPCLEVNKTVWNPATKKWEKSRVATVCDIVRFNCTIHAKCCNLTNIDVGDFLSCSLEYKNDSATVHYPNCITRKYEPEKFYRPCNYTELRWFFPGPLNKSETITIEFEAHKVKPCNNNNTQDVEAWCPAIGKMVTGTSTAYIICVNEVPAITPLSLLLALLSLFGLAAIAMRKMNKK